MGQIGSARWPQCRGLWLTRRCPPQRVQHLGFANSAQAYKALGYSLYPRMVKVLLSCLHATNAISILTYFVGIKRVGGRFVVWNGGKRYIYICIFNNYMEKVGGWEKNHDVEAFSPVSRSRSTLTICLKVAKGPGWSRIVWPTSLSISLLAIGKGTPWKLIQHLEQSGPI